MPYHPPLKIAAEERFFPKNGHWEKMKYMLKTVVIGLFSIDFVFLPPRQYPDSPRHHPDTPRHHPDTPRHHPDTPTHRRFYALEVTGRTMQYLSAMTKYDFYWIASIPDSIQSHPNALQTPSRHPPDTSQTPQNLALFGCGRKGNSLI